MRDAPPAAESGEVTAAEGKDASAKRDGTILSVAQLKARQAHPNPDPIISGDSPVLPIPTSVAIIP